MPQDKEGKELAVGDLVMVPATVKSILQQQDFANVDLVTTEPAQGEAAHLSLNARQVIKMDRAVELLARPRDAKTLDEKMKAFPVLQFFAWEHLPAALQERSRVFAELAWHLVLGETHHPAELAVALRKLLEAKDAAVRAVVVGRKG